MLSLQSSCVPIAEILDESADDCTALRGHLTDQSKATSSGPVEEPQSGDSRGKQSHYHSVYLEERQHTTASDVSKPQQDNTGVHIHFTTVNQPVRVTTHDGTNIVAMPDNSMSGVRQLQHSYLSLIHI